ncbi:MULTISPECIES: hypothetical protein [unclassified Halomonas]|uniref:hypothetical protein n=1 Tax=unclassified Halomonas TaxID=2609666 RepID=UPI00403340CC
MTSAIAKPLPLPPPLPLRLVGGGVPAAPPLAGFAAPALEPEVEPELAEGELEDEEGEDLVSEDLVLEDLVLEDLVLEDLVLENVGGAVELEGVDAAALGGGEAVSAGVVLA